MEARKRHNQARRPAEQRLLLQTTLKNTLDCAALCKSGNNNIYSDVIGPKCVILKTTQNIL